MKNYNIKSFNSLFIIYCIVLVSCKEIVSEIQIELPAPKPKLVVHSTFTPFDPPSVKYLSVLVSKNAEVFDKLIVDPVSEAKVSLFVDGKFDRILKYFDKYGYMADFYPKAGVEYSMSVEKEGFETVTAKGIVPNKTKIKACILNSFAGTDEDNLAFSQLSVTFDDPADQANYYEVMVLGYGQEKDKYTLSTNDKAITSESYYPSPILMDAIQPKRLLFNDKLINGKTRTIEINYYPPQYESIGQLYISPHIVSLTFRSVSEDYYKYYTTLFKHFNNRRADLLFGIAEPSPVFTNIKNGYGVFAGYTEDNRSFLVDSIRVR